MKAQQVLQESEERFRAMANSIPQLAWIAQADGYIFWYNQRRYEYTGTTPEQMEGWGWQSVHDPLVLPKVLELWRTSIATGLPFDMEFPLRGADGRFRRFLTGALPLKDAEGHVVQWFGTNTDITEHKNAEEEIRRLNADSERRVIQRTAQLESANLELHTEIAERKRAEEEIRKLNTTLECRVAEITTALAELAASEQEFRKNKDFFESIIENIPIMVFLKEARDLRFFRMNKAGQRLLGYSQEELLGKNDYDFFPKEEADFFTNADRKTLQGNKVVLIEEESIHTREGKRILRTRKIPLLTLDGTSQYLLGISEDITERKRAEEALRLSEERFRLSVEGVQDYAIFMLSPEGHVASWNAGAERIKGYRADEIIGKHFSCFYPQEAIAQGKPELELQIARAQGHTVDEDWRVRKDGEQFWANVAISALFDSEGALQGFANITRDMTEHRRIECALYNKNVELQDASKAKDRFLANMSHELRTPLNGIIGFAEFLVDGKPGTLNPKQKEYLEDILSSGKHLLQLINDVLDLAKVEAGKMELSPERFALREAIEEVCAVANGIAQKKRIQIEIDVAPELGEVTLDQQKFKQVLYNLLSNAIKFTDDGGKVKILATTHEAHRFRLVVKDTGIGIKAEDVRRLFREFEQLVSGAARCHEGTGLGLALTRKIMELQGGTIGVESEVGKGSSFTIELPLVTADITA